MSKLEGLFGTIDEVIRFLGYGLMALGIIACVAPLWSGLTVALLIGLVLLVAGTLINLFALRARESGKGNFALVAGGVTAICGLILTVQPSAGLAVVRWILIPYLLISGAAEAAFAMRLRPEEGWLETLGGAAVSIAAALALVFDWPISGARAIGLLVGGKLIATGWAIVRARRTVRSAVDKVRAVGANVARRIS